MAREGLSEEVMFEQGLEAMKARNAAGSVHLLVKSREPNRAEFRTSCWPSSSSLT